MLWRFVSFVAGHAGSHQGLGHSPGTLKVLLVQRCHRSRASLSRRLSRSRPHRVRAAAVVHQHLARFVQNHRRRLCGFPGFVVGWSWIFESRAQAACVGLENALHQLPGWRGPALTFQLLGFQSHPTDQYSNRDSGNSDSRQCSFVRFDALSFGVWN